MNSFLTGGLRISTATAFRKNYSINIILVNNRFATMNLDVTICGHEIVSLTTLSPSKIAFKP